MSLNRRGFLATLVAIPAAMKAVCLAAPAAKKKYSSGAATWVSQADLESCGHPFTYDWKSLHAPIVYTADDLKVVTGEESMINLVELKMRETVSTYKAMTRVALQP